MTSARQHNVFVFYWFYFHLFTFEFFIAIFYSKRNSSPARVKIEFCGLRFNQRINEPATIIKVCMTGLGSLNNSLSINEGEYECPLLGRSNFFTEGGNIIRTLFSLHLHGSPEDFSLPFITVQA